jgi:hypothetical protein
MCCRPSLIHSSPLQLTAATVHRRRSLQLLAAQARHRSSTMALAETIILLLPFLWPARRFFPVHASWSAGAGTLDKFMSVPAGPDVHLLILAFLKEAQARLAA